MRMQTQISLREQAVHGQRQPQRTRRGKHRQERMVGIEPHQSCGGQQQFGGHVDDLAAEPWQQAQTMHTVAALGHVRSRAALEVAIAETRNFFQEGDAQPSFEASPQASQLHSIQQIEE